MDIIPELIKTILSNNTPALTALLLLIAGCVGFIAYKREKESKKERQEIVDKFQKQIEGDRQDLLKVIEKYQEGQLSVIEALNELKVLIATIGAKL